MFERPESSAASQRWTGRAAMFMGATSLLTGCGGAEVIHAGDATVLVSERTAGGMDARLEGRLHLFGGCLGIEGIDDIGPVVVVWPHDTEVEKDDPLALDIAEVGIVEMGDEVQVAGGFITETVGGPSAGPVGGVDIPDSCLDYQVFLAN